MKMLKAYFSSVKADSLPFHQPSSEKSKGTVATSDNSYQRMRGISFSLLILFFTLTGLSRTVIDGKAPAYAGMKIKLTTVEDYVSEATKTLSIDQIAEDGQFTLYSNDDKTRLCKLEFGKYYSLIYLKPGTNYQVLLPEYTGLLTENLNERYPVNMEITKPESEKLNAGIVDFNGHFDSFIKDHFMLIMRRGAKSRVDSFKQVPIPNPELRSQSYFDSYVKYQFALLDLISSHSKSEMYDNYLKSKPILYDHDAYMKFFNEFYKDYFKAFYFVEFEVRLVLAVENHQSVDSLDFILSKNKFLEREDIRELVMIKELYFNTVNGRFKEEHTHKMLREIQNRSEIKEHKAMIDALLRKKSKLAVGTMAPEFRLPDVNGDIKSLSELRGKYVYLDFWATWCTPCIRSMKMMGALYEQYSDSIEFVSISIDKNPKKMKDFLDKEDYRWTFLHYNGNEELKEDYRVLAVPTYYLIDPNGVLIQSPAFHPESGIDKYFREIAGPKKQAQKDRFWLEKAPDK